MVVITETKKIKINRKWSSWRVQWYTVELNGLRSCIVY